MKDRKEIDLDIRERIEVRFGSASLVLFNSASEGIVVTLQDEHGIAANPEIRITGVTGQLTLRPAAIR